MTPVEQKRAAKSARKLAMEIVNGRRLELDSGSYCACAAHWVAIGAGLPAADSPVSLSAAYQIDLSIDDRPTGSLGLLSSASSSASAHNDQTALVFPLLATADALEALARAASETAP